jgi:tetratricopeptide (TPR) repeat protein
MEGPPGSTWNKLPKLGKAVAHAFGHGKFADAADALTGYSDAAVSAFAATAQAALEKRPEWPDLGPDRDVAAERLSTVLQEQDPVMTWGCALGSPAAVVRHVLANGGTPAIDEFAIRAISPDPADFSPGPIVMPGDETPAGRAFAILLDLVADQMHARARSVTSTDRAILLGALTALAHQNHEAQQTLQKVADQLADLAGLVGAIAAPTRPAPGRQPGRIVVGEDRQPREATAFVPRPELARVRAAYGCDTAVTLCQLRGMRGVGKSQLAAAYARECLDAGYDVVAWIHASTRGDAVTNLQRLAAAYGTVVDGEPPEDSIARMLDRFAATEGERRLIVFDSVESYADLDRLLSHDRHTQVLITTTLANAAIGTPVTVGTLSEESSVDYLRQRTQIDDPDGAKALATELGCLALALAQGASAMIDLGHDYAEFLAAITSRPIRATLEKEAGPGYPLGVARAIGMAVDTALTTRAPDGYRHPHELASELTAVLGALCLLGEGGVPVDWLRALGDPFRVDKAIAHLVSSSLAIRSDDRSTLSLHHLTRRVYVEDVLTDHPDRIAAAQHAAETTFAAGEPDGDASYEARRASAQVWLDHATSLLEPAGVPFGITEALVTSIGRAAFIGNHHHLPYAVIRCAGIILAAERVLGPDHPDTLTSRNNLAGAYEAVGDLTRAIALYEATLTDRERVLGPDHPDTLASRNNLAGAYEAVGDLTRAIALYEATLTHRERVLGPDHPDTLTSRNNLAYAYEAVGDLTRAIALYEATLTDRERVLGPDHPDTLISRNNLAYAYQAVGDLTRAIALYEATLTDRERVLGPDHPDTLISRNNLAGAYKAVGDLTRAIPLFEATLTDIERVLGPDHPDTLTSRNNLAGAYEAVGDLTRAIPLYEATLTDRERVLGPDHPDTLASRNNLAYAYKAVGDLTRAIPLYEATLTDRERVLGPDHPDTLASRNNLAYAYEAVGDLTRAIALYEATLTDRERVLGPDHPNTLISRNNLAGAYEAVGDLTRAIPLFEATLTDRERVLGPDHPDTLTSRNNLAGALWQGGDRRAALEQMEDAARRARAALSEGHPLTTHLTDQAAQMRRLFGSP